MTPETDVEGDLVALGRCLADPKALLALALFHVGGELDDHRLSHALRLTKERLDLVLRKLRAADLVVPRCAECATYVLNPKRSDFLRSLFDHYGGLGAWGEEMDNARERLRCLKRPPEGRRRRRASIAWDEDEWIV